ncbi:phospholipase D family protein [Marinobacter sp. V034]|uniref:phospholipase D family protein n=1 Tax=Marinobacter sp. V034 TaxID=3459610 RepID=UPI004043E26B
MSFATLTDGSYALRLMAITMALAIATLIAGCSSLPPLEGRSESSALPLEAARNTELGQALAPVEAAHPGMAGIYPLPDAAQAFATRVLLAEAAEQTLDIQYYIWRDDITGTLLLKALWQAAERGVRVRLLLDDNNTSGLDPLLAELDAHPNIQVRLFNPFVYRGSRVWGYITDFSRLNRRMHNKSFTADNNATVVGGRNVGDAYFGATDGVLFSDLDVIAVGDVVRRVSDDFDLFWASQSSYPAGRIIPEAEPYQDNAGSVPPSLKNALDKALSDPSAEAYIHALKTSPFIRQLTRGELDVTWARTRMVSDDPSKGLGQAKGDALLASKLTTIIGHPTTTLDLVSPYFVPTDSGVKALSDLAAKGVRIRVLTNSLSATDVAAVHAGYAKHRKALLEAGIQLYELKDTITHTGTEDPVGTFGHSASSLHAKTFAADGERVFVGSFNFDPRSMLLNTELGFVVDSPDLAREIASGFDRKVPLQAYEVRLSDEGDLYWVARQTDGTETRFDTEPDSSFWRRTAVSIISIFPIDSLL